MPIILISRVAVIPKAANQTNSLRPGPVRNYLHNVMEGHPLPSVPAVVNKLLELVQDPEVSMQNLCRVLADEPMLAARVLAVSRSAGCIDAVCSMNLSMDAMPCSIWSRQLR